VSVVAHSPRWPTRVGEDRWTCSTPSQEFYSAAPQQGLRCIKSRVLPRALSGLPAEIETDSWSRWSDIQSSVADVLVLLLFFNIVFNGIRFDGLFKFNYLHQHSRSSAIDWVRFFKLDIFHFAAICISVVCEHIVTSEHHKANAAGERAGQGLDCAGCRVRHRASNCQTQRNGSS
jgi:hypothetical protein